MPKATKVTKPIKSEANATKGISTSSRLNQRSIKWWRVCPTP